MALRGIHHITAITGDAPGNVDFYVRILGLRMVKKTVNFDVPDVYHLYFADETGSPGAILTFFEYPGAARGRHGSGMIHTIQWGVASTEALAFWESRLLAEGVDSARLADRLRFEDPEGLGIELLVDPPGEPSLAASWDEVPADSALTGFSGVRVYGRAPSARELRAAAAGRHVLDSDFVLTGTLGFERIPEEASAYRLGEGFRDATYSYDEPPSAPGRQGAGSVHHIAWACEPDDQPAWRERVAEGHLNPTPIIDRQYFHSIYFREPSGVLFEIATIGPGFAIDEPIEHLGESLQLPPQHEHLRSQLEVRLTPSDQPPAGGGRRIGAWLVSEDLGFEHFFVGGSDPLTLLLLHGTGGNEKDLLGLGKALAPNANLLSPRGKVLENGMPRFFRRLAVGVFDVPDLMERTHELAAFVEQAVIAYSLDPSRVIAVGYSNGANIAASLLILHPRTLAGAALLHAMPPFYPDELPDLDDKPILLTAGRNDSMVSGDQAELLGELYRRSGAEISVVWFPGGHELTPPEIQVVKDWLQEVR